MSLVAAAALLDLVQGNKYYRYDLGILGKCHLPCPIISSHEPSLPFLSFHPASSVASFPIWSWRRSLPPTPCSVATFKAEWASNRRQCQWLAAPSVAASAASAHVARWMDARAHIHSWIILLFFHIYIYISFQCIASARSADTVGKYIGLRRTRFTKLKNLLIW